MEPIALVPLHLQTLSCDACFTLEVYLLARGAAHDSKLLIKSGADSKSVPCTCFLDLSCQDARLLGCCLGYEAAFLRVRVVFATRFFELLLLRMQDGLVLRGIAEVLSQDQVVCGAHDTCLFKRIRGRTVGRIGDLAELGLESKFLVALVTVIATYVRVGNPTINEVIPLQIILQVLAVLCR